MAVEVGRHLIFLHPEIPSYERLPNHSGKVSAPLKSCMPKLLTIEGSKVLALMQ